jgi:hypothetical protein
LAAPFGIRHSALGIHFTNGPSGTWHSAIHLGIARCSSAARTWHRLSSISNSFVVAVAEKTTFLSGRLLRA